jgi:hypothetical protein
VKDTLTGPAFEMPAQQRVASAQQRVASEQDILLALLPVTRTGLLPFDESKPAPAATQGKVSVKSEFHRPAGGVLR